MPPEAIPRGQWQSFVREHKGASYFTSKPCVVKRAGGQLVVRPRIVTRWLVLILMLGLSVLLLYAPWLQPPGGPGQAVMGWKVHLVRWLGPPMGLALLVLTIRGMLFRRIIVLDEPRGTASFVWGFAPRAKRIELPLERLQLVLFQLHRNGLQSTTVGIAPLEPGEHLCLWYAEWRGQLLPLFTALSGAFGERVADRTQARDVHAAGGRGAESICRTPIKLTVQRGRSRALAVRGDEAVLRGSPLSSAMILIFALGLGGALLAYELYAAGPLPLWGRALILAMLFVLLVAAVYEWPRRVIIRRDEPLQLPRCVSEGNNGAHLHGSDIAAVQLCRVRGHGEHIPLPLGGGIPLPDFPAWQVNLVAKWPAECRVNLICDTNQYRADDAARQLAELLGVPLLDHR